MEFAMNGKLKKQRGFTLVELMIVVVIIGVLASIAMPKFSAVIARSKLTELKNGLWHIVNLEKSYYNANFEYVEFAYGDNSPILGFNQPDPSHFTYAFVAADTAAYGMEKGTAHDINFDDDGNDGLYISVTAREGVVSGSAGDDFAW
jgi:prepilin-type N-terminal cleavage/methylation domain-containing protein